MNRALRNLGVLTAGLLLLGGLAHAPAVADEATTDPAAPTIAVGQCFDLTTADTGAASIAKEPTDCAAPHTTEVIAVSTLPEQLTWSSPKADLFAATQSVCARAWNKVTGGNLLRQVRSQYDSV